MSSIIPTSRITPTWPGLETISRMSPMGRLFSRCRARSARTSMRVSEFHTHAQACSDPYLSTPRRDLAHPIAAARRGSPCLHQKSSWESISKGNKNDNVFHTISSKSASNLCDAIHHRTDSTNRRFIENVFDSILPVLSKKKVVLRGRRSTPSGSGSTRGV